jgi:hypothetical protein
MAMLIYQTEEKTNIETFENMNVLTKLRYPAGTTTII